MASIPLKPEYGPTLGELLAPRWHAAPRLVRAIVLAAGVGLLALAVGGALTLENAHYAHGGSAPFSFSYRGLYRTAPAAGEYVQVQRLARGRLEDSFAVGPLRLPRYTGSLSAELPLYAASYIDGLRHRYAGFVLRGEGKTRVNTVPAYAVAYIAQIASRTVYGRDILLLPEQPGARVGVHIVMLSAPRAQVKSPLLVGTSGVLERPLETFTFG
ncbi:MAG TPA: hypothetical protein VNY27_08450 [Solirubrobacteraceae bacterium]|jgi:hypothetical protein|nr:hypothetical protein [Solirubrobacteraceae bacterium]